MLTNKQIQKIIRQWKAECKVTHTVLFRYWNRDGELIIFTDMPGYMIGCHGETVEKYTNIFKGIDESFRKISFIETKGIA